MVQVQELPYIKFGLIQTETFAPVVPVLATFAEQHHLSLERYFDQYPLRPEACWFLTWHHPICRGCFIRICASDPFNFGTDFRIGTSGREKAGWDYSVSEGPERLRAILEQAKPQAELCRKAQQLNGAGL